MPITADDLPVTGTRNGEDIKATIYRQGSLLMLKIEQPGRTLVEKPITEPQQGIAIATKLSGFGWQWVFSK